MKNFDDNHIISHSTVDFIRLGLPFFAPLTNALVDIKKPTQQYRGIKMSIFKLYKCILSSRKVNGQTKQNSEGSFIFSNRPIFLLLQLRKSTLAVLNANTRRNNDNQVLKCDFRKKSIRKY